MKDESLRGSGEQFHRLLDELPDPVLITEKDCIVYMNESGLAFYGYELNELTTRSPLSLVHPEDHHKVLRARAQIDAGKSVRNIRTRVLKKDGSMAFVEYHSHLTTYNNRQARLTVVRDITERQASEEARRQSDLDFRNLIEHLPDPILIYQHHLILFANQAAVDLFGYGSKEEVIGTPVSGFIHADDLKIIPNLLGLRKTPFTLEARGLRKDGTTVFVESKICMTSFGGRDAEILILRDITLRRKLDQEADEVAADLKRRVTDRTREFQTSERRLFEILNSSQDAIISMNFNQEIISFNRGAEIVFQFKEDEIIGQSIDILLPDEVVATHRLLVEEFAGHNTRQRNMRNRGELAGKRKSGELFPAEASISKVELDEGQVLTVFLRDITEKKKVQMELQASELQLRQSQKMDAIGQLAGGIAHDFNNLLTAITGYSEWLLEELEPSDNTYQDLREIKKAADRAATLTRQLLAFSRKQVLRPQVIDINKIVSDMTNMLRRLIGENIELVVQYCSDLQKVYADPGQMEQVILNLTINARDVLPEGGTVTVTMGNIKPDGNFPEENLSIREGIWLSIADNGPGINQEQLEHIFEPFYTTKGINKGTGLGLSTVFGIVKQSGGDIRVISEPGQGADFQVYLPATEHSVMTTSDNTDQLRSLHGTESLLIVEDDQAVRELLHRKLGHLGYTILIAEDGQEALLLLENYEGPIDLVITDVIMPRMGGHELARRLSDTHPKLPVLYMSGYDEALVVDADLIDMEKHFIQKPFEISELAEKIRAHLDAAIR